MSEFFMATCWGWSFSLAQHHDNTPPGVTGGIITDHAEHTPDVGHASRSLCLTATPNT